MSPLRDWLLKRQWKTKSREVQAASRERQRLLRGREELVAAVSALLFEFDPVGINFEDNTDEYDPEAETIVIRALASPPLSVEQLTDVVHAEFVHWFGSDTAGPRASYVELAAELRRQELV